MSRGPAPALLSSAWPSAGCEDRARRGSPGLGPGPQWRRLCGCRKACRGRASLSEMGYTGDGVTRERPALCSRGLWPSTCTQIQQASQMHPKAGPLRGRKPWERPYLRPGLPAAAGSGPSRVGSPAWNSRPRAGIPRWGAGAEGPPRVPKAGRGRGGARRGRGGGGAGAGAGAAPSGGAGGALGAAALPGLCPHPGWGPTDRFLAPPAKGRWRATGGHHGGEIPGE